MIFFNSTTCKKMDPASAKSVLSSSEVAFPRGGASLLSPLEVKTIQNQATEDVLFEQANNKRVSSDSAQPIKKRKKQLKAKKDSADGKEEKAIAIEHFSFANLLPGASVLGQIVKIDKMDLSIACGDNLVGHVPITSISAEISAMIEKYENSMESSSDEEDDSAPVSSFKPEFPKLDNIFQVGQWLRAAISPDTEEGKKRIQFTIEPEAVNATIEEDDLTLGNVLQASVQSIEDHGVVLNLGIEGFSGFMSKKEMKKADVNAKDLKIGQVILTSVASVSSRTVTLRPAENENVSKKTVVSTISSIDAVHPGAIVNAIISEINENGVAARVFGMVDGTFSFPHVEEYNVEKLRNHFGIGSTVRARVIGILIVEGVKRFVLSRAERVISLAKTVNKEPLDAFPVGFVFHDGVEVIASDQSFVYVSMGASDIRGQIHKSNLDPEKDVKANYAPASRHRARVLGFNEIDNILIMTFNPKAIDSKFVSTEDIPVGEYIPSCEVTKILPDGRGLIVKVFGDFDALVPANHLSDIKLVYPERKFKVGTKVKGRLLSKLGKKLFVTIRKSLVNMEDDAILSTIDNATIGFKTSAVVEKFIGSGVLVQFFGHLKAYLPKSEISETFVENARDYLKEGQAVSVRIMNVNTEENRITVTLRQSVELTSNQMKHLEDIEIGRTVVTAKVVEKAKEAILVELDGSNLRGVINTGHLSDGNYEDNRIIFKGLKIGGSLEVIVLEKDMKARAVIASAKKSLIHAAKVESFPVHYEEVHVGSIVSGFIKSVTSMGIFVSFGGRLTGLVLAKNATEDPTEDLSSKFYKHQSVACNVIRTDDENKRFLLSLTDSGRTGGYTSFKLKNPIDDSKKSITDYSSGVLTAGIVESIEPGYLKIRLADNLEGRLEASQCIGWSDIKDTKNPLASFSIGKKLKMKVIGYYDNKSQRFAAVASFTKDTVVSLTALADEIKSKKPYRATGLTDIEEGSEQVVYIEGYNHGVANVSLSPSIKGEMALYDLSEDFSNYEDFHASFPLGSALKAKVIGFDFEHGKVILSARSTSVKSIAELKVGEKYPAKIFKVTQAFVLVELGKNVVGYSYITDSLNDFDVKLEDAHHLNEATLVTVTEINKEGKLSVSLRNEKTAKDFPVNDLDELKRGTVVKGFVKAITNAGLYVSLGRELFALVRVPDISDAPLPDWKKFFTPYQCVVGKISQCLGQGRISMTLKESEVNGKLSSHKTFEELVVGENYDGSVKKVADFGVFIKLDGTANVSGLCHRSEIADMPVENVAALFGEGDRVKVKVLKIDQSKKQLSLGMKASYFTDDVSDDGEDMVMDSASEDESEEQSEDEIMDDAFDNEEGSDAEEDEKKEAKSSGLSGLSTNGFDWTASILDQAEEDAFSSDDDEDFMTQKKKKRKGKKQVEDKTGELNSRAPQSVADFERMLVGNPDSSILWMNYMSFQLQLGEIDKSREIAERALKTINYREEQEKMNIWIAILNLENSFGGDESLDEAFKRSIQYMDSLTMHQKLVGIYQLSEKFDKADELYKAMTKKFGKNISVWVQYGSSLMDRKLDDEAHQVLARALQALPKREHIELVRKFGQLEFTKGDAEQGRSLFEGLVTDAPKRIDLWNVYIDQEIKVGDKDKIVALFERVVGKKLSRKQAKFFFSKWLTYEDENGDEQSAARVKALAVEYVQSQAKDAE